VKYSGLLAGVYDTEDVHTLLSLVGKAVGTVALALGICDATTGIVGRIPIRIGLVRLRAIPLGIILLDKTFLLACAVSTVSV
jgi:hypothetical protein